MFIVLVFAIGWITNLYNFMDGSDGLAGGMAVIGFGTYGLAAWLAGSSEFALLAWSITAASAAFLFFNFSSGENFHGRRRIDTFGLSGWSIGRFWLAAETLAAVVSPGRIRTFHCRCPVRRWFDGCCGRARVAGSS
jgi:hypothetical protein